MHQQKSLLAVLIAAGVIGLAACGGGGSGTGSATQISGTAASGAPFAGATITLTDANGTTRSATAGADGSFTIDASGLTAPFVLKASGTVGGAVSTYVAVLADGVAAGTTKTLNVTPLTTAVAALLSDNNDPLDMTDLAKLKAKATPAEIKKAVDALKTVLANVIAAAGADVTAFDPMTTSFKADRSGLDSVLDAVKVTVAGNGVTLTNAFAAVSDSASEAPAIILTKTNLAAPPAPLTAPTVTLSAIAKILDGWRDQLNACFALTAENRVTKDGSGNVIGVKGACAQISGFDVGSYKSNGYTLYQRYGSLLADPAMDGAKFGMPEILTLTKSDSNEDFALFRLSYTRSDGDTNHVVDVAKKEYEATASDSGWRVVGNQRNYDASIEASFRKGIDLKNNGKVRYASGFRLYFNPLGPNASDVNAVKITGPGLPAAGVVLGKSTSCGTSTYLVVNNKTGNVNIATTTNTSNAFNLDSAYADKSAYTWPSTNVNYASALVDVSTIKPFSRYRFDLYRADASLIDTFYARITAGPVAASYGDKLQWNELTDASKAYLNPSDATKSAALTNATIDWTRNPSAAPIESVSMYGYEASSGKRVEAEAVGIKQASASTAVSTQGLASSAGTTNCTAASIPALNISGNERQITVRSRSQFDVRQYVTWYYQN